MVIFFFFNFFKCTCINAIVVLLGKQIPSLMGFSPIKTDDHNWWIRKLFYIVNFLRYESSGQKGDIYIPQPDKTFINVTKT